MSRRCELKMEDESSNDVIPVETTDHNDVYSDKPIMQLFRRLIGNDNKQNTVLTNSQIKDLLQKEFMLNISELHELEVDIYMNIIKKFLKDWPLWDEFDQINKFRAKKDQEEMNKYLHGKYEHLKNYLSVMLDIARPKAKDKVLEVEQAMGSHSHTAQTAPADQEEDEEDVTNVILEISCNRTQLNSLFYRKPHPKLNDTVFNANTLSPSTIFLEQPDYDTVLNWWNVRIIIKMPGLSLIRETTHDIQHRLVNKKLNEKKKVTTLNPYFQEKLATSKRVFKGDQTEDLKESFRRILAAKGSLITTEYNSKLRIIFGLIEKDLKGLSDLSDCTFYRKYYSSFPYVRHLYTDVAVGSHPTDNDNAEKYDLQLEETISPMYQIHFVKILSSSIYKAIGEIQCEEMGGIQLECKECLIKFKGLTMLEQLKQHIWENHFNEPDWDCTNCNETFSMVTLAKNRWHHDCEKEA